MRVIALNIWPLDLTLSAKWFLTISPTRSNINTKAWEENSTMSPDLLELKFLVTIQTTEEIILVIVTTSTTRTNSMITTTIATSSTFHL